MKFKKFLFLIVLLTIASRTYADGLTASTVNIKAGGTASLEIGLTNQQAYNGLQFDLFLPEGVTIKIDDEEEFMITKNRLQTPKSKWVLTTEYTSSTNSYRFVLYNNGSNGNLLNITGNSGTVFEVTLQATANILGNLTGSLENIVGSYKDGEELKGTDFSNVNFSVNVQEPPTVTADNKTRAYGEANPEFTYTVTGGTISVTPTLSTEANETSDVGDYPITVQANSQFIAVNGTLTVTKAPLTITAKSYSIQRGQALPSFGADYSGFKNNETESVLGGQLNFSLPSGVTSGSEPGTYNISVSGATSDNYDITYQTGTLTITEADPVTVTANSYTITYGDALPNFGYTSAGATLNGEPAITCTATASSGVGTYPITITKGSVTNFSDSYVNGTLTINPAPLTITAENKSKAYGDANPEFTATYEGLKNNETSAVLTTQPTFNTDATAASAVGTYDITVDGAAAANYTISYNKGQLTVNKATLTVTANSYSRKQGEENPAFDVSYNGWKNGESVDVLTSVPTATTTATPESDPGTYDITVSGGQAANYDFNYVNGTLTVTSADPITITANSYTIEYGEALPAFEFTSTGATISGTPSITCEATTTSPVGTYPIVIAKGTVANYNVTYVNGTLTIKNAPLIAKAKDKTVEQGLPTPEFDFEYTGFKNNETEAVLTSKPTASTTRELSSVPGDYPITATGGVATNYDITCQNGTLTVTAAAAVTVTAKSYTITYGAALPDFSYTSEGATLNGEPAITCTATASSGVGTYPITITKGSVTNYNDSYVNGTLTINPAPLKITAENKSKAYGDANPEFTATYEGFVKEETSAVLTAQPTFSTEATEASVVGSYDITVGDAAAANYTISYKNGQLTVNKATLTATANDASRKQGEANPAFVVSYSGWKNGDDVKALTTEPTATTTATTASAPGTYDITVSGGEAANYDFNYVKGTLTVTNADPITITANSYTIKYGEALPTFEFTSTGAAISGTPSITCEATTTSPVGTYPIKITKGTVTNYNETYVDGVLTIEKAPLTAKAKDKSVEQGMPTPEFDFEYTGFKNNETEAVLTTKPTASTTRVESSEPGTYPITATGGEATNYEITCQDGTLTVVLPAQITVTVINAERNYGAENPEFLYTAVGGELNGAPTLSCTATKTSAVGEYEVTIEKGTIKNYNVVLVPGKLTVNGAPLTITAVDKSKTYGDANPEFTATYSGFVNDETDDVVTTKPTLGTTATVESGAGTYKIQASAAVAANYAITYADGTLTVNKAKLTAKAKDATRKQGEANPAFEIEYSGWKNNDDATALTTAPTATTTATPASEIGTYDITVSGGEAANYDFVYEKGTLNVTAADPITITAKSYTIKYGEALPTFEFTSEGATLSGTPSITCEATTTSPVGTYPIVIAKGTVTNYNETYVNGVLTIEKAPLTAKAKNQTVQQGKPTPTLEIEYTGFKNNETEEVLTTKPTASTTRVESSELGDYPITVTGGEATNYEITCQNGTLTVVQADQITVTVTNAERNYGSENPEFQYTVAGGELDGAPVLACTATKTSAVGEYNITIEKGTIKNYNVSLVPGKLTVKGAPLTVTAADKSKTYGDANPEFTATYSGFVNDETDAVVTTKATLTTTATVASGAGEYAIVPSGAVAANYAITYVNGALTVNKAKLTAKAKNATRKQGEANPAFEIEYSGWKNNDGVTALTTAPTATTTATPASAIGTYDITVSGGEAANYDFVYEKGTLTVTEADAITITANSYTIKYGDNLPTFGFTSTGATISGTPSITCEASKTSPVGTYPIVITKGSVTNYNETYVNGVLTIEKAPLTAKAKDKVVERGKPTPTLDIEYTGFKNNETEAVLTTKPVASTNRELSSEPGKYTITVTGGEATNYEITCVNGTLTVTPVNIVTITVNDVERNYGSENPTFEYTVTGGELEGEPVITCTATATSPVGEYEISIAQGTVSNSNYNLVPGILTVNPVPLTITAENKSRAYGDANPEFTADYEGFVNNETSAVLTTQPTFSTNATVSSGVGTYNITVSGAAATNYTISYANGQLTVNKATLTAKAKDATRKQKEANPTFEIEYSGWKNGEGISALTTAPTATTTATPDSDPGTYDITVSGGQATNYDFNYVKGTLTVTALSFTLTYMVDGEVYKTVTYEYGATITPEAEPTKEGYSFSGWSDIPEKMPAENVVVTGTFTQVEYKVDDATYEVTSEGTVTFEGAEDQKGEVTIESTVEINGQTYQVTAIAENAFKDNKNITAVTIPETITTIGDNAFNGCTGLVIINIGKLIQAIGNKAFANIGTAAAARRTRGEESSIIVNCYAETLPETAIDAFENTPIANATLMVVDNLVDQYKATSPWSGFGKIQGFDGSTGINSILIDHPNAQIFDMQGNRIENVQKGVNIIRTEDGKTKKVIVK